MNSVELSGFIITIETLQKKKKKKETPADKRGVYVTVGGVCFFVIGESWEYFISCHFRNVLCALPRTMVDWCEMTSE